MGGMNLAAFTAPAQYVRPIQPFEGFQAFGQLQALAQMGQLRQQEIANQQQQMQLRQVELQQHQIAIDRVKAINDAYMGAFTPDANGVPQLDQDKLIGALQQSGHGEAIPDVMEGITKYKTGQTTLAEANAKLAALQTDHGGEIGAIVKAADYNPHLLLALAQDGIHNNTVNAVQSKPWMDALNNVLAQDPTGATAKAMSQRISDRLIANSPKQQELEQKRAATAGEQAKAEAAQRELATNMLRSIPIDPATGKPAQGPWNEVKNRFGKLLNMPDEPSTDFIKQLAEAGISAKDLPKYQISKAEAEATQNLLKNPRAIQAMAMSVIDYNKYPQETMRAINAGQNALSFGLGTKGVQEAIQKVQDRIAARENAEAQASITSIPFHEDAQARALREDTEKSYQASSKELDKFGTPVSKSIQDYNTLKTMLANPNSVADSVLVPEFLKFTAGGSGSGLRMTKAEMDRIFGSRSAWENARAIWQKITTGQTLLPEQRQKMAQVVDSMGQRLLAKDRLINQGHDDLIQGDIAGHKATLQKVRRGLDFIDQETPGQSATGAPTGGAGGGPVVQWTRDAQGNPVPVR